MIAAQLQNNKPFRIKLLRDLVWSLSGWGGAICWLFCSSPISRPPTGFNSVFSLLDRLLYNSQKAQSALLFNNSWKKNSWFHNFLKATSVTRNVNSFIQNLKLTNGVVKCFASSIILSELYIIGYRHRFSLFYFNSSLDYYSHFFFSFLPFSLFITTFPWYFPNFIIFIIQQWSFFFWL